MSRLFAAVYPVPENLVNRLLVDKRNVFVKYLPHTSNIPLKPGDRVVFYASRSRKEVVGEGIVKGVEFIPPSEAMTKYGDRLFLSNEELQAYTSRQPSRDSSKKLLAIVFAELKKYSRRIPYPRPITMAGEYLTKEQYKRLLAGAGNTRP